MRFVSKLTIAVAAIFFALSVSAHAGGHGTTSGKYGNKIYQVCKKWRVDQGGPMPTNMMQHCRNRLFHYAEKTYKSSGDGECIASCKVFAQAREDTKADLGYW